MKKETEDFPDLLSPMLVKELRQGMRTKIFVSAFVVLQVLMVVVMSLNAIDYGSNPDSFKIRDLNGWFWVMAGLLLLLAMPLRGVSAISSEEKAKTLELIFLTRLTSWRIVVGKWGSLMFQSALFALALLPYAVLRYFFGNVNLIDDLVSLALLLWMSCLMTTATVGISGYSGFLKGTFMVLGVIFGLPAISVLIEAMLGSGAVLKSMRFGGAEDWQIWSLLMVDSVIMGVFFLEMAAAQIAPDAENHMLRKRGLALLCLLLAAVMSFVGFDKTMVIGQLLLSAVGLGFCCAEALCSSRPIMLAHVESFSRGHRVMALAGRFFYPGWPCGVLFSVLSAALLLLIFSTIPGLEADNRLRGNVMILTGVSALLTPLVIFSVVMKRWRQAMAPFFVVQVIFMVTAIFAYAASEITRNRIPVGSMLLFPPSAFWVVIFQGVKDSELELFMYAALLELMVGFILLLFWSRPFWIKIKDLELQARGHKSVK